MSVKVNKRGVGWRCMGGGCERGCRGEIGGCEVRESLKKEEVIESRDVD